MEKLIKIATVGGLSKSLPSINLYKYCKTERVLLSAYDPIISLAMQSRKCVMLTLPEDLPKQVVVVA